jgi:hypothetical protein
MKWALNAILAAAMLCALCTHQAPAQEKAAGAHPSVLEYEGVLTASDERAETMTLETGSGKVVLSFTGSTFVKARRKNSASLCYESRGGVLLSITLAQIIVGDRVHVVCEPVKSGSGIVCRKMTVEVSVPHPQNHTRLSREAPSVL